MYTRGSWAGSPDRRPQRRLEPPCARLPSAATIAGHRAAVPLPPPTRPSASARLGPPPTRRITASVSRQLSQEDMDVERFDLKHDDHVASAPPPG
eukprot:6485936-Prymnesium_polylepis.4